MADLTTDQYARAIRLAEDRGLTDAAEALRQEAVKKMTGGGSFMEKLGAGVQDVVLGTKQLFGQTSPDDIKEHNRIADMATGGTLGGKLVRALPMATTALLPGGGATVAGRMAAQAGYGALEGLLSPTEDPNVLAGKTTNALLGGATGGAFQGAGEAVAPVLRKTLSKVRDFLPGGAARVAEREFVGAIPQADRAAAEQALSGSVAARTAPFASGVSGAPQTAAVATRQPALLAAEREAREAGGMLGQPFRNLDEAAAAQRWQHLEQNVGGDVPLLTKDRNAVSTDFMTKNGQKLKPGDFDPTDALWKRIQADAATEQNPALKAELTRIRDHYMNAKNAGDLNSLHRVRMEAFDDTLDRLYQSDKKAANSMAEYIRDYEKVFDKKMDLALGGKKWSAFRDEYKDAATSLSQAKAGEDFLTTARTWNETPGGVPQLTGKRQQMANLATKTDDYGRPVVSPDASDALQTVRREITEQMLPQTAGPRGSATAQNLNPTSPVLSRAIAAQNRANQGILSPVNLAAMAVLDGGTAAGAIGLRWMADKRALSVAEQLIKIHVDPARAAQVLQAANLPPQTKQNAMAAIAEYAKRATSQGAVGLNMQQMNQPQEQ